MINKISRQIFKKSPWDDFEEEEDIFTKRRKKDNFNFNDFQFNFSKKTIFLLIIAAVIMWLSSGIYKVSEGQEAAVLRFGRFDRIGIAGLNYHLPFPVESVIIEKVNQSRRIEIGYRSTGRTRKSGASSFRDIGNESNMLTGDENIVELNADVMWHISDLAKYSFNVSNPQETVKAAAESAIREVIGNTPISDVLSSEKQAITLKVEALIQQTLDQYEVGVMIEQVQLLRAEPPKEVIQAYRDVQTAKADKEKLINQAQAYNNDIIPKARGEEAKVLEEANGYKAEVIAKAKGDAARFNAIYKQYAQSKDVTKTRLYLEAIEEVLNNSNKVIMGGDGLLPHMAIGKKGLINQE
ncbi:MAG: FtsH protease activity modulator HflK [Rickettsiaceae bacterium]|nr:FtsH protease activity modulator HflK [Rickettsiaceae bacterium]